MSVKICGLYGRESVLDETIEHGSTEQQKYMGIAQAESLSQATGIQHVIKHFLIEEQGVSGKDNNRPKYQELLRLIRLRKIDVVLSKEISRLNRSVKDFCDFMGLCEENKVAVRIKGLDVDPNTPMGKAMFQILAVVAELEREMCRERVRGTLRSAAINNKKINGGPVVLGFDRDPERKGFWIPNRDELQQVEFLMKTFTETLSFTETIKAANLKGITNKTGTKFQKNSIRSLLTNQKYIGKMFVQLDDRTQCVDLPFGAVVPVELFEKVQHSVQILEERFQKSNKNDRRAYPLSGLLKFEDGSKFTVSSGTGRSGEAYLYYRNRKNDCTLDAMAIEKAVIRGMKFYEKNDRLIEYVSRIEKTQHRQLDFVVQQIAATEKKVKNLGQRERELEKGLGDMNGGSKRVSDWLDRQLTAIDSERQTAMSVLDGLKREQQTLTEGSVDSKSLKSSLKSLFDQLEKAPPEIQRGIFRQVFKDITVFKDNTVKITWLVPTVNQSGNNFVMSKKWLRWRDSNPRPSG